MPLRLNPTMPRFERRPRKTATYDLQTFLAPMHGRPTALYLGAGSRFEPGPFGGFHLGAGDRLEGDTFFNAFFLEFWRKSARLKRVGLRCAAAGDLRLRVVGHLPNGDQRILAGWDHSGKHKTSQRWVWKAGEGEDVLRLSLHVEAAAGAVISDIAFVTDRPPWRPIRLAVGIVTHEREVLFAQTAQALADLSDRMPDLRRVHVINHGAAFGDESLRDLMQRPLFRVVDQPNLGGCGGFARAMIEAMDAGDRATHLLLMDDDIVLDPRIVLRAATFAAHAVADVAVGGQAIELERPTRLQEAWGRLGSNWLPRMEGNNLDLTDRGALSFWDHSPDVHYNGWWFSMIPMRAVKSCGLPTPVFLRGDDIEYGLRLRAAGVPTVPLPGLGVWHASVRYKHAGLVQYYDLRNGLITAATHPELAPPPGTLHVLGWALHHLLVHRYRAAAASLMAVADFLDGPQAALTPNGTDRHRRLTATMGDLPVPERRHDVLREGLRQPEPFDIGSSVQITAWSFLWIAARILVGPVRRDVGILQVGAPDPRRIQGETYFLALEPNGRRCLVMVPRKWLFLRLLGRALWLALRHGMTRGRAAQNWRAQLHELRARARWEREFAQAQD